MAQWGEVTGSAHFRRYRSLGCMCPPPVSSCLCQSHQAQRAQLTRRRGSVTVGLVVKPRALAPTLYVVPVHLRVPGGRALRWALTSGPLKSLFGLDTAKERVISKNDSINVKLLIVMIPQPLSIQFPYPLSW